MVMVFGVTQGVTSNHFNKKGTQALNSPTNYKRIKKDIKICFHNSTNTTTTTEEADKKPLCSFIVKFVHSSSGLQDAFNTTTLRIPPETMGKCGPSVEERRLVFASNNTPILRLLLQSLAFNLTISQQHQHG